MRKKTKILISFIIYALVVIGTIIPLIFWLFNPGLSAIQIISIFKWIYIPILIIWVIYVVIGIKNKIK